jgi:hypothetical protein
MKQHHNGFSTNTNKSTVKDSNNSEEEEIPTMSSQKLKKGKNIQLPETFRIPSRQDQKKIPPDI